MSTFTHALSTNNYGPETFIVSTSAANGTHTTVQSAITAANAVYVASGNTDKQTVWLRDGIYNENLMLLPGVNLAGTSNAAVIVGSHTLGSNDTTITLNNLAFLCIDGNAIFTSAGGTNRSITAEFCDFFVQQTGGGVATYLFNWSTPGDYNLLFYDCFFETSNGAQPSGTVSDGSVVITNSIMLGDGGIGDDWIDVSGTGGFQLQNTLMFMGLIFSNTATGNINFSFVSTNSIQAIVCNDSAVLSSTSSNFASTLQTLLFNDTSSGLLINANVRSTADVVLQIDLGCTVTVEDFSISNAGLFPAIIGNGTLEYNHISWKSGLTNTLGPGLTIIVQDTRPFSTAGTALTAIRGHASFDSTEFTVTDGFVQLAGGGLAIDSIAVQTGTSPIVPTAGGLVTINGAVVAAGTNPVRSDGTGANTMAIEVQIAQALAATDATKIGLANFDSAAFDVDANGFVQLNGGGIALTSIDVDAHTAPGTDPVVPTAAGQIAITGAQVATGTIGANVIRTDSLAANSLTIEIQRSTAVAATDSTKNGVSHFDSARFSVDSSGFVSINGSGIGETITGNSGGALSPTLGNWNILGASTAAGTSPVTTSGAVSTLTVNVQKSQAIAATDATKVGLANFDSSMFSVDANGFVQLAGGGQAIDSIAVQTGTSPIVPTVAGLVTINGAVVAAGTNPIRTDGTGANTLAVEVQTSQALAATDATKIGLCNFDSARFTCDANGFVSINGAGVGETITGQSGGALSPTAGNWNINGATVAAGTSPLVTSGSGSTLTINAQRSQAIASADSTKVGLSNFDSAKFTVDSNGFVSTTGGLIFPWSDKGVNFSAAAFNGYFITASVIATLPGSPANGDTISFFVDGAFVLTIQANTGQTIQLAQNVSSTAGTQASTATGDACTLVYRSTDTKWVATSFVGAWNKT